MLKKLAIESALIVLIVILIAKLVSWLPLNLSALKPLENLLKGFDMMDIYYSVLQDKEMAFCKDVVLINIADANRSEIADLIMISSFGNPKAIGVDVLFEKRKDSYTDSILADVIRETPQVILGAFYQDGLASLKTSTDIFKTAYVGYTNFIGTDARYSNIRYFKPVLNVGNTSYNSFAVALAKMSNTDATNEFLNRNNENEIINYIGNYNSFLSFEKDEILEGEVDPELFRDKVVIIGFLGNTIGDQQNVEDRFFTPLNPQISGRSVPDMNGMVLHANIVNMILNKDWINTTGTFLKQLIAGVILYLHILLFMFLIIKWNLYFDALSMVLQIISTLIILLIVYNVYHYFNYRIYIANALVGVGLSVELLFVYEAVVHTLYKKYKIKSVLITES